MQMVIVFVKLFTLGTRSVIGLVFGSGLRIGVGVKARVWFRVRVGIRIRVRVRVRVTHEATTLIREVCIFFLRE